MKPLKLDPTIKRRSPNKSVQEVFAEDSPPPPEIWCRESTSYLGSADLSKERYTSRAFHDLEMERVWPHVWQVACHVQQIPKRGDYVTYDIGRRSVIVVRSSRNKIKAYHNACLHRGTQLCQGQGNKKNFECPFHAWTWGLDGDLRRVTAEWDFAHVDKAKMSLPEVRVDTWQGMVFINFDDAAPPLEEYLQNLPEEYEPWPLSERYLAGHISKICPANWKITMEAFMEGYHVYPVHPEFFDALGYEETQYDVDPEYPHTNRMITATSIPGTDRARAWSDEQLAQAQAGFLTAGQGGKKITLPEGMTSRQFMGEWFRKNFAEHTGVDFSQYSDAEMMDGVEHFLFPNLMPWAGFGYPAFYRFRPNGDDHETSIMDVYVLFPWPKDKPIPPAGPTIKLGLDQKFADANHEPSAALVYILDQDLPNIERVQKGLHSLKKGVTLANYQESRIRHYHQTLDCYIEANK